MICVKQNCSFWCGLQNASNKNQTFAEGRVLAWEGQLRINHAHNFWVLKMSSNSPTLQLAQTDTHYLRMGLILALYTVALCLYIMRLSLIKFDWFGNWTHTNFGVQLVRLPTYSIHGLSSISKMFDGLHVVMLGVACHKLTYSHMYAYLYTVLPLTFFKDNH